MRSKLSAREHLTNLEREGAYVFHGSRVIAEGLEPRQAFSEDTPDGKPAIFASPFADYAIFMALVNEVNCPKGFQAGVSFMRGRLTFRATQSTLDQLKEDSSGYVYVFKKADFQQRNSSECVSYKSVRPESVVQVTRADFVRSIDIIEG